MLWDAPIRHTSRRMSEEGGHVCSVFQRAHRNGSVNLHVCLFQVLQRVLKQAKQIGGGQNN